MKTTESNTLLLDKFNYSELGIQENIKDIFYYVGSSRGEVLFIWTKSETSILFSLNN